MKGNVYLRRSGSEESCRILVDVSDLQPRHIVRTGVLELNDPQHCLAGPAFGIMPRHLEPSRYGDLDAAAFGPLAIVTNR